MTSSAAASSSSASSHSLRCNYDVFLSFRGMDTREGFTSHLYEALNRKGIFTFMDNQLPKGEEISRELLAKIEQSRFSIVVFSENYASSRWCLNELASIHWQCKVNKNLRVFPIFYKVTPSEIRHQRGDTQTGKYMANYEQRYGRMSEKVRQWKNALTYTADLTGWEFKAGMVESIFIDKIVKEVSSIFNRPRLSVAHYPVGLDEQVQSALPTLEIGSSYNVRMMGIIGPKGIGKSTIAKALYNFYAEEFEASSFLSDVRVFARKHDLVGVQEKLLHDILLGQDDGMNLGSVDRGIVVIRERLCCKKILLVIDGVDDIEQLRSLAGEAKWFGSESRIIITAEDRHLLEAHGVNNFYEMKKLSDNHSYCLFCWYAFKTFHPPKEFKPLLSRILARIKGCPFDIIRMASDLYGKGIEEWGKQLARLEDTTLEQVIDEIFKICYRGLDVLQKVCFLIISLFFNGKSRDEIEKMLDEFVPDLGRCMEDLVSRGLITIKENFVWVHEMALTMARTAIRAMSNTNSQLSEGLEEATDDIGSLLNAVAQEILKDSDKEKEEDEMSKLMDNIELDARSASSEGEEVADELLKGIESATHEAEESMVKFVHELGSACDQGMKAVIEEMKSATHEAEESMVKFVDELGSACDQGMKAVIEDMESATYEEKECMVKFVHELGSACDQGMKAVLEDVQSATSPAIQDAGKFIDDFVSTF